MADFYKKMNGSEYDRYKNNKNVWESATDKNSNEALAAAKDNQYLRDIYGMGEDTQSYMDMQRDELYNPYTNYTNKKNDTLSKLESFNSYNDPYASKLSQTRDELANFSYNPENDPAFNAYKDKFTREGQAAQNQTLSNLTGITGGRANSWAATATANVGQAYAQKIADIVPELADKAYSKLLQRYNLDSQESDRAYGRFNDSYGRAYDRFNTYNQLDQQDYDRRRQGIMDNDYLRNSDQTYKYNEWKNNQDYKYGDKERELNLQQLQQAVSTGQINLDNYPEMIRQQLEQGWISIEQANANLALTNANISQTNKQTSLLGFSNKSGGGGSPKKTYSSGGSSKEYNKSATDEQLSNFLYSASDYSGNNLWSDAWGGQEINPAYAAMTKLQDAQTIRDIKDTLIANGYTSAQANTWIENAKKNAKMQIEYADSLKR